MTPTARTLAECKKRGWIAQTVERPPTRYNPRRIDLFGVIDIVAVTPTGILGIQATTGAHHANRAEKALAEPRLKEWLKHARFEIWSWAKRGARGTRKLWALREEPMMLDMLADSAVRKAA